MDIELVEVTFPTYRSENIRETKIIFCTSLTALLTEYMNMVKNT